VVTNHMTGFVSLNNLAITTIQSHLEYIVQVLLCILDVKMKLGHTYIHTVFLSGFWRTLLLSLTF